MQINILNQKFYYIPSCNLLILDVLYKKAIKNIVNIYDQTLIKTNLLD